MTLGARIEERLKAIGISQAELARRVGVRQSTINSLINGSARTSRSLLKIARELETSPEYLTGETDDPDANTPDQPTLAWDERELIYYFCSLDVVDRKALLQVARAMAGNYGTSSRTSLHSSTIDFKGRGD